MAKRWYSVSVLSNFEKKVAEQIRTAVADAGLKMTDIDGVFAATSSHAFPTMSVVEYLGLRRISTAN